MPSPTSKFLLCVCLAAFVPCVAPALADMKVKLKDGRVLSLPVEREEVDSITFGPGGADSPAQRAADRLRGDAESVRSASDAVARAEEAVRKAEAAARAAQAAADAAEKARSEAQQAGEEARAAAAAAGRVALKPPRRAEAPAPARNGPAPRAEGDPPRVLKVGPGQPYTLPSQAAKAAGNGDVIEIQAGTYNGDVAVWRADNLVIRGVGGPVRLLAGGRAAQDKGIWVIAGDNTTVQNVEFSGARVRDRNGAGIRQEGAGLIVRHCRFVDNEMGILAGSNPRSDILIEHSEFARNTTDYERYKALGHNVYVGRVRSFTLRHSWVHGAVTGHNVKSRALRNLILYNRIGDEADGGSSYLVDLSNGGASVLLGNVFHQGPRADNWAMVSYGTEGTNPDQSLFVVNNTFVNDKGDGIFVRRIAAGETVMINNILAGKGKPLVGGGRLRGNLIVGAGGLAGAVRGLLGGDAARPGSGALEGNLLAADAGFADPRKFDFRLTRGSPAIDAGEPPGSGAGMSLRPDSEYRHPLMAAERRTSGAPDIGAFEFASGQNAP